MINYKKILAFDPGATTGWVMIQLKDRKIVDHGTFLLEDVDYTTHLFARIKSKTIIIIERFRVRPGAGATAWSSEPSIQVIGVIKKCAKILNCTIVMQEPAQGKRMTNDILRDAGYDLDKVKNHHIRDALRHAVVWMRKQDKDWHLKLANMEKERICQK